MLDKEAELVGKKSKKISVDKQLLADFTRFREMLSKDITKLNQDKGLTEEELDESVQRILDRLIFIRNCEDRELEARELMPALRDWESRGRKGQLIKLLRTVFDYFDTQYNSKLFQEHLCDKLDISDEVLNEVVNGLYQTMDKAVYYDFSAIEADVLGNIYEQYLGHILRKTAKRAKVTESHARRKEQGIYYTPPYIVDYIVRNTLGDLLKRRRPNEVEKIRVLDPACGSGSFLIKSFDILNEYWKEKDKDYAQAQLDISGQGATFTRKVNILRNNIFGVDLDKQAVEIAQLNLLLKIAEKGHRLPLLQQNIKCGNSLIADPNIAEDKAFKWEEEFKEIMDEGGFDVVVGNPPYIFARSQKFSEKEKEYYYSNYKLQKYQLNTYGLFVERAYKLLKSNGIFGFIIPNNWLTIETFSEFREFIIKRCSNSQIINLYDKVFEEANVDTCILLFRKGKPNKISLAEMQEGKFDIIGDFKFTDFENNNNIINIPLLKNKGTVNVLQKVESISIELKDISKVSTGLKAYQVGKGIPKQTEEIKRGRKFHSKQKISSDDYPYLEGRDVSRYNLSWSGEYLRYGVHLAEPRKSVPFKGTRILVRQIPSKPPYCINAVLTDREVLHDINSMVIFNNQKDYDMNLILGIINSKLISYWFFNKFGKLQRKLFPQFKVKELKQFPIAEEIDRHIKNLIIRLVDKILSLNKRRNELKDKKTDERARIEEEIKKTDKEIDELVYKLYDITEEEKKIIED
ncbi:MAG: N-6 DNA methylase [Methanophagales archaeon]|nr:N-6 DNA methylase [Methanophagales archaeon]